MSDFKTEDRDGMRIDWDAPIPLEDGVVLRCDVYRPQDDEGKYPVIMTYGPYGKYLHFEDLYETCWTRMVEEHPDVPAGSTNKYQNWEVVDPEKWVPDGYVGRSCGFARRGPLPRRHRHLVGARGAGFLPVHRMGGGPALEHGQDRPERHLLLRHEPVAGGRAPAAAPERHVRLGGGGRLLPGNGSPRRHLL